MRSALLIFIAATSITSSIVGQTPSSAPDVLGTPEQADQGVGRRPGGRPYENRPDFGLRERPIDNRQQVANLPHTNPSYTAFSIVNAADSQSGPLAANTIATIYGQNLSYTTAALASNDISGGLLPLGLPGSGVNVLVGGIAATVFYVSPTQINFLVPNILIPGQTGVQVVLNSNAGPIIPVTLADCSPALFQLDAQTVIATRLDGSLVTASAPAQPGDILVFYANGLGPTVPPVVDRFVPQKPAQLQRLTDFQVLLDGVPLDHSSVLYAGIAPGYAGLYQINVKIPSSAGQNPQIQIGLGSEMSPSGLMLPLSTAPASN